MKEDREYLGMWYGENLFTDSEPKKILAMVKSMSQLIEQLKK